MCNNIEELISASKERLQDTTSISGQIGNRPEYPMAVFFNKPFTNEKKERIFTRLSRIWVQSVRHLVAFKYNCKNPDEPEYYSFSNNGSDGETENGVSSDKCTEDAVVDCLDNAMQKIDAFGSMDRWCAYNVIDTSEYSDLDEFVNDYQFIKYFQQKIIGNLASLSMCIVLLDDSLRKQEMCKQIREWLSNKDNNLYNSTIVASNHYLSGGYCYDEDLQRVVSCALVLSNNNNVSSIDDDDYRTRITTLYNGGTHTVSYQLFEKPNKSIAIVIIHTILDSLEKEINGDFTFNQDYWTKNLVSSEITKTIDICEKFLKDIQPDCGALEYLPLKNIPADNQNVSDLKFSTFSGYLHKDVWDDFVNEYTGSLVTKKQLDTFKDELEKMVYEKFPIPAIIRLTDNNINQIIDTLNVGRPNGDMGLNEYFKQSVYSGIRKRLYNCLKKVLKEISESAKAVKDAIARAREDIARYEPAGLKRGDFQQFVNVSDIYLNSDDGIKEKKNICRHTNKKQEFYKAIYDCLVEIVKSSPKDFEISFIDEWAKRIDSAGDEVYRSVSGELTRNKLDRILLNGHFTIEEEMTVYMMHTFDQEGHNPTELYKRLKSTFKDDDKLQYFNTGNDDMLQALTFVSCNGTELII
ncbi:MAG: hypothetical protein ACI4DY_12240 [Monoglobaceae bacterium]